MNPWKTCLTVLRTRLNESVQYFSLQAKTCSCSRTKMWLGFWGGQSVSQRRTICQVCAAAFHFFHILLIKTTQIVVVSAKCIQVGATSCSGRSDPAESRPLPWVSTSRQRRASRCFGGIYLLLNPPLGTEKSHLKSINGNLISLQCGKAFWLPLQRRTASGLVLSIHWLRLLSDGGVLSG